MEIREMLGKTILRRLGNGLLVLFGVSLISFWFSEIAPGDFFDQMRLDPQVSLETVEAMRSRYGLDRPLSERYLTWLGALARGDLGFSLSHNRPVSQLLWERGVNTLLLTVTATGVSWLVALLMGVWIAARRGRLAGDGASLVSSTLLSVPDLVLGLLLLLVALKTGWFPTGGKVSVDFSGLSWGGRIADFLSHLVLPLTALVLTTTPVLLRHVSSSVGEVLQAPFVLAARSSGLRRRRLLLRHVLPAAANPLISLLGLSIASLLSASLLIEVIMSWPGMGPLLLQAIFARDIYLVLGAVLASSLFLVAGNLLADLLLFVLDPRTREQ